VLKSHVKQDGQVHENAAALEIVKIVLNIFVAEKCPDTAKWPGPGQTSLLNSAHCENTRMQQDCNIHEEIAVLNIVEIVFDVFVNQVVAITAELP
jgi:hypothetical protein